MTVYPKLRSVSCDTMVAIGEVTASGRTIFAKNSDRHPNEAQYLTHSAGGAHPSDDQVDCTRISIPQAEQTFAVIGSRPWWMWGFEHGVNELGVAVGNEALWSREPSSLEPGLLGMDLVRLVLERATSAEHGMRVLIDILERFGQSGSTNLMYEQSYQNGFIIADPQQAWVVETAGRHWAAKQVRDVSSISNAYSIGNDYDRLSTSAIAHAEEMGWYVPDRDGDFDFAAAYADPDLPFLASCTTRLLRSRDLMNGLTGGGGITTGDFLEVLRDIGAGAPMDGTWRPGTDGESAICMHAQDTKGSETAASVIAELSENPLLLVSLSSPRLSTFVPVWFDTGIVPWEQPATEDSTDEWWEGERMQRLAERDYAALGPAAESLFQSADRRTLAALGAITVDAAVETRAQLTVDARERRQRLVLAITELLDTVTPDLSDLSRPDPRGDYLTEINALISPTNKAYTPRESSNLERV